ncbi:MAG TPA: integrase arm-type DNA-binding domain-containing protein, partial [Dehalococcoidia bacterium]|nr:integrase arm-type DNA-binding domain-containing protein [Dehalococcoidia bacterium]
MRTITTPGRYGDGGGLYLVVDRSGARRWVVRLVVRGTRHDLGLGSASAVSLAEARAEAARLRALARRGGDPLADRRRAQRPVPTVREAAIQVHAQRAVTFRSAKHRHQWLQSLAQAVFPVLGDRPVDAVTSSDILAVLTPIWTTTPETARRVKQRLKVIFEWAVAAGYRPAALANPVEGVTRVLPRPPRERAHHPALPYAQVPALLQTLATVEAYEPTKLAFEFLILTAARTSEVLGARWDEIDRDARLWV